VLGAFVFFLSAALAILASNAVFSDGGDNFLSRLFSAVPGIGDPAVGQDILAYVLILVLFLTVVYGLLRLAALPLIKKAIIPLSGAIGRFIRSTNGFVRRLLGGLWQLPKAVALVLGVSLLFSFYTALTKNTSFADYIDRSRTYRLIEDGAIEPIISSEIVQKIPAFLDNAIDQTVEALSPEGRRLLMKVYINGATVDEAVASCPDIDNTAIDLIGTETDDYAKARILYDWIVENIDYDREKAEMLEVDSFAEPAGAVAAFSEKTGVCFDKACLYVSMCRAVGVPVRLLTGEAYNGTAWESHSWNQVCDERSGVWVNVDATFGKPGQDYFDRDGFEEDHKNAAIQGEWPEP
jgi:hypothetical protein